MDKTISPDSLVDAMDDIIRQRKQWNDQLRQALEAGNVERVLALAAQLTGVPPARKIIAWQPVCENVAWELHVAEEK